ncbi:MAG TPA: helix-turn-helix transcriptional regulator [Terriglobia bacterium]|nr:helix-turn-helix transcriptional regulator [Terriglobia bacterium]
MFIGQRIRELRERKGLSQNDIEEASGLRQWYLSWVEHGQTVPSLETLERIAAALEVPLYWLFYSEDDSAASRQALTARSAETALSEAGSPAGETRFLLKLSELTGARVDSDPACLLDLARRMLSGKPVN